MLTVYDPAAMERAKAVLGDSVRYAESVYAACDGAEAVLILTEWEEFANLDLRVFAVSFDIRSWSMAETCIDWKPCAMRAFSTTAWGVQRWDPWKKLRF